jgi:MFS family permease
VSRLGALSEREFRLLFFGQSVSAFGDRLIPVALAFAVLDLTGSVTDLGLVLAAETIPNIVFLLVGGVWADRLSRKLVMVASDALRCATQAAMAVLLLTGSARVWQLLILSGVYGVGSAFFSPAATGLTPQAVSPERLQQANALLDLSRNAVGIVGPAVAGVVVAATSPGWALAIDAVTFAVSAWTLAVLRPRAAARALSNSALADLRAGWHEFRSRTWIWTSVSYFSVFTLFAFAPFLVLGPYVAKLSLGGAGSWATILAAGGVGAVIGGLIALRLRPARPLVVGYAVLFAWTPQIVLLAVKAPVALIAAAAAAGSAMMALSGTVWFTTMQQHVPDESLSRVSAYDYLGTLVFWPIGFALVGPIAAHVGISTTLWASAAASALSTIAILCVPSVRQLKSAAPTRSSVPVVQTPATSA